MTFLHNRRLILIILLSLALRVMPAQAQEQCGVVSTIGFPVDRSVFQIVQDFGVPSPRHEGFYHTGEDYYGGRGTSYGQSVHAIATGQVTYSAPTGWGRDGGVVIIQHRFPDGSVAYSMYGHMQETDTHPFPQRFACIQAGDIVGTVGDIRPAPHLHLEIRTNQPDVPGPGYTEADPTTLGWLQPTRFIEDWQAWLLPAHRWHSALNDNLLVPPLLLNDGSMMALTQTRLRGLTPDGRVLWRINLEKTPLALSWYQNFPLLTFADGTMQQVNFDGTLGDHWSTNVALDGTPVASGNQLLFHSPDNALLAFAPDRRSIVWRLENVPPFKNAYAAPNLIGLLTGTNVLLSISPDGKLLDEAKLAEAAGMSSAPKGDLLVYTQGGFWQVDASGTWSLVFENAPPGGEGSAALLDPAGNRYFLSRQADALDAFSPDGAPLWQTPLSGIGGRVEMAAYNGVLLLTSNSGNIVAVQQSSGALCNQTQMYGNSRSILWHNLGQDGILRLAVGDQILGLDWKKFIGGCV